MVELADLIWREFDMGVHLGATSDLNDLVSQIMQGGPPADVIVSFGHVLVQTSDQEDAIDNFADILSSILLNSNLVVAVDAQNDPATQRFIAPSTDWSKLWQSTALSSDQKSRSEEA